MKMLMVRGGECIGDLLMASPVPRLLKKQDCQLDALVWDMNQEVFWHNPYINELQVIPNKSEAKDFLDNLVKQYDRMVDLRYSVEGSCLHRADGLFGPVPTLEQRREVAWDVDYYAQTCRLAGVGDGPGRPELYVSLAEQEELDKTLENKRKAGIKLVLWHPSGSCQDKRLFGIGHYLQELTRRTSDVRHYLVGTGGVGGLPQHPHIIDQMNQLTLRQAMLFTSVADLVVGPESSLVNTAAAFDTPTMTFYSNSRPENLARNWLNHHPVIPDCECHPCYLVALDFREVWDPERRAAIRRQEKDCMRFDGYASVGYRCKLELDHDAVVERILKILEV
jgi:ADP-heptose:LPS heptosyltransferase